MYTRTYSLTHKKLYVTTDTIKYDNIKKIVLIELSNNNNHNEPTLTNKSNCSYGFYIHVPYYEKQCFITLLPDRTFHKHVNTALTCSRSVKHQGPQQHVHVGQRYNYWNLCSGLILFIVDILSKQLSRPIIVSHSE